MQSTGLEIDFQQDTEDVFGVAGLPATIECTPPISVPPAVVTWYKDNHLLVERDGEFAVSMVDPESENWKLHFVNVQKNDEGEYFCVATNNFSVPTTRTSRVAYFKVGGMYLVIIIMMFLFSTYNWIQLYERMILTNLIALKYDF